MSSVISIIAILSILIGAMGLFGLASISINRRIKEIGVRKVLGASRSQLVVILSSHFARLILISFIIAVPVTYYFLSEWLESFAYRIDLNIGISKTTGANTKMTEIFIFFIVKILNNNSIWTRKIAWPFWRWKHFRSFR